MIERRYEDDMICDLAQFYHLFYYKQFPMPYIATLVCGLPSDARVIKKISNTGCSTEELLLAKAVDYLSMLWWSKTVDGQKNRNRPHLITESIYENKKKNKATTYDSPESFENARNKIIEEKKNGKRS